MKLLIGYDGSKMAEAALDDLQQAGLPGGAEALVLSVAEVWLPSENFEEAGSVPVDSFVMTKARKPWGKDKKMVGEAEIFARHAQNRLAINFPFWKVKSRAADGSPAREILAKADDFEPDLIVVGSHGRSSIGRLFLGSISQKILTEAKCSVRVARGRIEVDPTPARIIIGFDGSPGALAAVEVVASRVWSEKSEVRLAAVINRVTPTAIGRFVPPVVNGIEEGNQGEREWLNFLAGGAARTLEAAGLTTSVSVRAGNPKQILVEEAEQWYADAIFVGANRFGGRIERCRLGSVAAAVAARAHCSVEVVRTT